MTLNTFIIYCLLFFAASASMSMISFDTQTEITNENLKCLQSNNYLQETYIWLYTDGSIHSSVNEALLKQASIQPHAVIMILNDSLYPDWAITQWTNHILSHNYRSLWLSWAMQGGYKVDCEGVWKIFQALRRLTNQIGIFMSPYRWSANSYLNIAYCQRLNQFPLFYEDETEFQPFEGWNTYSLKVSQKLKGVCSVDEIQKVVKKA